MKSLFLLFLLFLLFPIFSFSQIDTIPPKLDTSFGRINTIMIRSFSNLEVKSKEAKSYASKYKFDTTIAFMIDMSIPSGKKRFFVVNLNKDTIETAGLVAHGYGSTKINSDTLCFSNLDGSYATSLGKYEIMNPYYGKYGLSYRLLGLDSTNNNAMNRSIVLHSYAMPDDEIYPNKAPRSLGCPMVSPSFFTNIEKYIKTSNKPILMWIYN